MAKRIGSCPLLNGSGSTRLHIVPLRLVIRKERAEMSTLADLVGDLLFYNEISCQRRLDSGALVPLLTCRSWQGSADIGLDEVRAGPRLPTFITLILVDS